MRGTARGSESSLIMLSQLILFMTELGGDEPSTVEGHDNPNSKKFFQYPIDKIYDLKCLEMSLKQMQPKQMKENW